MEQATVQARYVHEQSELNVAGVEGIEPPVAVLETAGLPLTDTPNTLRLYSMRDIYYKDL